METPQEFIEEIARSKGSFTELFRQQADEEARQGRRGMLQAIQGAEEIRRDLSKSLDIISADLYTSRARFLMEVIQNADDNQYLASAIPTLRLSISPQLVKIEGNEIGFTKENVRALCRIGQSSKPSGQGYTGEKGIGFKSVFKIAERAHIRSPPYYFQLDKARMLGMITPLWDDEYFATHSQEHQTTIILDQICDTSTDFATALKHDIETIHPTVILFLRRLERLQITLSPSPSQNGAIISKRFRRYTNNALSGIMTLENEDSGTREHFYKLKYTSSFNGTEKRRLNLSQTDIVLAFPVELVSNMWVPKPTQLHTYAYLPLGNFGFKFIIQADFLTTSNRQSVDEDSSWNANIARAIPQAFVNAVSNFNRISSDSTQLVQLAKTWPLFLKGASDAPSPYWRNIQNSIVQLLKENNIIQTRSGSYASPRSLMFLSWAKSRDGEPMFGSDNDYVSSAYPPSVSLVLVNLGVRFPDSEWVSKKLKDLQRSDSLHGTSRSSAWYSDLAKVILSPGKSTWHSTYISELRNIPLIPLSDGQWSVAPTASNPIYFPQSLGARIPSGLPLTLVEEEAVRCEHRRELFELLGVKDCDASNIVKEIISYHERFTSATRIDIVGHAKYLYHVQDKLKRDDMKNIYFAAANKRRFYKGYCLYMEDLPSRELAELFSTYEDAPILDSDYFQDFNGMEKRFFIIWLKATADIATVPRFKTQWGALHADFRWLLNNRNDHVLGIIRQYWDTYGSQVTSPIRREIADHSFLCQTQNAVPLRQCFIPLPDLVEHSREFCGSDSCSFLTLSGGLPSDWRFLAEFDVGTEDNLDFYLWILRQPGFKANPSVERAKKLYLEIQSRAGSNAEKAKARAEFRQNVIAIPGGTFVSSENCVYYAPQGFRTKPSLFQIYGGELSDLFRNILCISFASSTETLEYLGQLRSNSHSTMQAVLRVYKYIQDYFPAAIINPGTRVIAIPSESGALEWKTPSECVWDDSEFSQNGLQLQSKIAMRQITEQHDLSVALFFTSVVKLQNAGINELLGDLTLMQQDGSDDPATVFRLYERIEVYRRSSPDKIKHAFQTNPLVFLRGYNGDRGQWLKLADCVWSGTILRTKQALLNTLGQYRGLFRDTLDVPNVTLEMLVQGFLGTSDAPTEDNIAYSRELLLDISRKRETESELRPLKDAKCWPCRLPTDEVDFCTIGEFYVNDRQNLFDVFKESQTFLDLNFDDSRRVRDLLRKLGCLFLSEQVTVDTEAHQPLQIDQGLSQNYQRRADALNKYFEHNECRSTYDLVTLLQGAKVWISPNIKTHYHLLASGSSSRICTVTRVEGGSCVRINNIGEDREPSLDIYLSSDTSKRDCALVTDFPNQLIEALQIRPHDAVAELYQYLEVPFQSLDALLVRKGIVGEVPSSSTNLGTSGSDEADADEPSYHAHQSQSREVILPSASPERRPSATPLAAPMGQLLTPLAAATGQAAQSSQPPSNPDFVSRISAIQSPFRNPFAPSNLPTPPEGPDEAPPTEPVTTAGLYSTSNRGQNIDRLQRLAQNSSTGHNVSINNTSSTTNTPSAGAFDMTELGSALEDAQASVAPSAQVSIQSARRPRPMLVPNRNQEERARDFEIGFLGEYYVFMVLRDRLGLPNFTGPVHWTSSLRTRAGFTNCADAPSDFTYQDMEGALTRHLQQMQFPYTKPTWLDTVLNDGNKPTYLLEVKSTPYEDPTTRFFLSGHQHALAKRLQVTSTQPTQIYAIVRVSGLNSLEDGMSHEPRWRIYLDPYSLGEAGFMHIYAPTYTVTAVR